MQVDDLLAIVGSPGEDISGLIKGKVQSKGTDKDTGSKAQEASKEQVTRDKEQTTSKPVQPGHKSGQQPVTTLDISKMDEVVLMPRLSDTMEEGVIAVWHKNVGDTVKKGEVLAEIETDKATMELESYKNGTLLYIGAQQGEKIAVNSLLCIIGEKGKVDVDGIVNAAKGARVPADKDSVSSKPSAGEPQPVKSNEQEATNGRVKASPLAKKLAREKGIDLNSVQGSGDGGRITKADIDNYRQQTATAKPFTEFASVMGEEGYTDISNSQIRNVIARRLAESKFSAPHFYLTMEINMDNAIAARTQLNEVSPVKISFNDLVVKAAALALRQHPAVNASWMGDKIRRHHHIHIGIAVAIEDGLIVPVIRFADQKELPQIAAESKELSGKARNKKLQPNEFTGNTFTVSNLGMMDIDEFTAIINPPDSCIMAVGKIKEAVVSRNGGFAVTNVMKVTMSCDHRSVDGATGAAFLQTFKKFMENPISMLLGK